MLFNNRKNVFELKQTYKLKDFVILTKINSIENAFFQAGEKETGIKFWVKCCGTSKEGGNDRSGFCTEFWGRLPETKSLHSNEQPFDRLPQSVE